MHEDEQQHPTGPPPGFAGPQPGPPTPPPAVPFGLSATPPSPPPPARKRSVLPVLLVVVLLVALVAFGATQLLGGGSDDPGDPADTAAAVADAIDDTDPAAFCALMTEQLQDRIAEEEGQPCRQALRSLFAGLEATDPGPFEVDEVERDGDRATFTYRWAPGDGEMALVVEDGEWRLADEGIAEGSGSGSGSTGGAEGCQTERRTVETAVEAYYATYAEYPADAAALVDAEMLRDLPEHAVVAPDGTVTMTGDCA